MKIIRNKYLPFKGFSAVNLFGVVFVRNEVEVTTQMIRHESIHTAQMKELWYVGFYILYGIEGLIKCLWNGKKGYYSISFEQEAYINQEDTSYVECMREKFSWVPYIFHQVYTKCF